MTALQASVLLNSTYGVEVLFKAGADPNIALVLEFSRDWLIHTPVQLTAKEILDMLIAAGAKRRYNLDNTTVRSNCTAWRSTSNESWRQTCLRQMPLEAGASPNLQDGNGDTPLHIVARKGAMDAIKLRLKHRASVTIFNCESETPLVAACDDAPGTSKDYEMKRYRMFLTKV